MHPRLNWPGLITGFGLAPANVHDLAMVPGLAEGAQGVLLGDRNYWSPTLSEELRDQGLALISPFRSKKKSPGPGGVTNSAGPVPYRDRFQSIGGALPSQAG